MDEIAALPEGSLSGTMAPPAPPRHPTLADWLREGGRAAFLLKPRIGAGPAPWQVLVLLAGVSLLELGAGRLEVPGPANFHLGGWLEPWWTVGASVLLMWCLLWKQDAHEPQEGRLGLASWYALWIVASTPVFLAFETVGILRARDWWPALLENSTFAWGIWLALMAWLVAVPLVLARHAGLRAPRLLVLFLGLAALQWTMSTYFYERPWYAERTEEDAGPRLTLSQESFEKQQEVWQQAVAALAPERPGVRDVYGLVFAPYAREDVFLRESTMVADVLAQRFDAQGRVLHLVNHATTGDSLPWATPTNLRRAVDAIAQRMDREHDVLVVYLTSHGARNFKLSSSHWPLKVDDLGPMDLQRALEEAGVRHRVIAISACYSGGWIAPLAADTSLVMTAADPTHTSYGCGTRSELTFFGRAVFNEQLRSTHSFERAFAAAVPLIQQREQEAGKSDGFSNPQISVGAKIRPVLEELEKRLEGTPRP